MKDKLLKLLALKQAELKTAQKRAESSEDVAELRSIHEGVSGLKEEIRQLEAMVAEAEAEEARDAGSQNDDPAAGEQRSAEDGEEGEQRMSGKNVVMGSFGQGSADPMETMRAKMQEDYEQRGADLKAGKEVQMDYIAGPEERAVTVGGGTLVVETKYSRTLSPKFNEVSGLIDQVNAVPLQGGEAYKKGFEISDGEGDYTAEGADYTDAEPTFGSVTIGKACVTAYAEITKQAEKLPNVDYNAMVQRSIRNAIRKKITKQLVVGAGTADTITGIYNAPVAVIPLATDIPVSAIDEDTLDAIVFGYGGDENVEGDAVLILNKTDLAAFNAVRLSDGDRAYEITMPMNGNMGVITSNKSFSVPFIINSACGVTATATVDDYTMVYGKLPMYEMPIFSQLNVMRSDDYKFKTGNIAYRGEIYVGGNVTMYKGFVRVKKA